MSSKNKIWLNHIESTFNNALAIANQAISSENLQVDNYNISLPDEFEA